jgi:hypothetical protein
MEMHWDISDLTLDQDMGVEGNVGLYIRSFSLLTVILLEVRSGLCKRESHRRRAGASLAS